MAALVALLAVGCGTSAGPRKVFVAVGETKTFDSKQLPAKSKLICRLDRGAATIVVPDWSTWDSKVKYGWMQSLVVGNVHFGMRSEDHGKRLRVSCVRSPGGLR